MVIESNPIRVNFLLLLATVNNLHVFYYFGTSIFYLNTNSFHTRFVIKLNVSTFTRFLIVSLQIIAYRIYVYWTVHHLDS